MSQIPLNPSAPFVWPDARAVQGMATYTSQPPFGELALQAKSAFGIVTGLTVTGVKVIESWLQSSPDLRLRILIAVYPTCATRRADLTRLRELVQSGHPNLGARVLTLDHLDHRASNALCFIGRDSEIVHLVVGPAEDLATGLSIPGQVSFAFRAEAALAESFKRYFDLYWFKGLDIGVPDATDIPSLVVPAGTEEAQKRWEKYQQQGAVDDVDDETVVVRVDPETGQVTLETPEGQPVESPTEEIGLARLDPVAERVARLYEAGSLVSIDKLGRIPPLDAPIDPRLFGDIAELHQGSVVRKLSLRASIIDERTLKEVKNRQQGLRNLLNRFTFPLAENMRWLPDAARKFFESEVARLNDEGQAFIKALLSGGVEAFINAKRTALEADINAMHASLGRSGPVPKSTIDRVVEDIKKRLKKAESTSFLPTMTYSKISFARTDSELVSPWGQAYSLLAAVAEFPRKALTDGFFFRGLKVNEDELINAMNVADDALLRGSQARGLKARCKTELELLDMVTVTPMEPRQRCELVWRVIAGEDLSSMTAELRPQVKK
jgi:hypothetical protein